MNKSHILKTFVEVRWTRKFKDRKSLEKYQKKMLDKQIKFIKENSPYFKKMKFNSFEEIPYMDKKIMMDYFNELNTVGVNKDEALELAINSEKTREFEEKLNGISVGLSSGTSGHRGLFVLSDKEIATWVGGVMAKLLPKNTILNNKVAFFLRADNNLYEGANTKVMDFRYFDILKSMDDNVSELDKFNPTILIAPPSVLMVLSKYVEKKKLNINPIRVISVAEVLTKEDEKYFKKTFKQERIYQVYQCTEGFLGYTCDYGSFHINEDVVYVEKEYIDKKRFVPIITDFIRSSQPIVRYRLNDILVESDKKCKCGSPLMVIEKIEGRMDDIFLFDNKDGKEINVFPDFISRCLVYVPNIKEYKIYQKSKTEMIVYVDNLDKKTKKLITKEFENLSKKMNFKLPVINFEKYTSNLSRKMKRVERGF